MPLPNPLENDMTREKVARKILDIQERGLEKRERRARPIAVRQNIRVGTPHVSPDTPGHTPGTRRGEEVSLKSPERGRVGTARHARSATSINPALHDAVDHRMPHLPPA